MVIMSVMMMIAAVLILQYLFMTKSVATEL